MRATKATAEKNFIKIQKKIINLQIEMILYLKITNEQKFNYMLRFICLILLYLVSLLDNFNYYLKIQKYHHELKKNMLQTQKLPYTYQQSIKNKQFNTSALTVWAEEDYFYLEPNYSKCLIPTVLIIDRKRKKIKQVKSQQFKKPTTASSFYFSFFIGIIDLNGKKIMMLSESVQIVCTISKREIFKITKPIFLFYNPEEKKNLTDQQAKILINLVTIYQSGMYFSYAYNLTQPLHYIKRIDIYKVNSYFNWAQPFQNQLVNCNSMWSLPVIQGFVNKIQLYTNAQKLRIILISRRSLKQGGPWQYNCGLTQKGHSANYVQTQQILAVNHLLFSFLQIRGSAPIMWSQKFSYGVPTGVSLQKSIQQNYKAFKLHISNMLVNRSYQNIILFNLLSKQSSSQKKLIQNFEYLVKATEKEKVLGVQGRNVNNNKKTVGIHYAYFDFHARCPSKNYKQLNKFINEELQSILLSCGFTAIGVKQSDNKIYQILNVQKGVIRTNCGTCIDRTNITQCRLAAYQLVYILNQLNVKLSFFNKNLQFIDDESSFGTLYRNLWADNADNLSKQYTGTGSINSVAVRKGSLSYMTTIDHGMKSLVRALRNVRQEDEQKNKTVVFMMRRFRQFTNKIVQNPIQKQNLIDLDEKPIEQKQQKLDNNIEELRTKQDIPKTKQTEPQSLI